MTWGLNQAIQQYLQSKQMQSVKQQLELQREALEQEKKKLTIAREKADLDIEQTNREMDIAVSGWIKQSLGIEPTPEQVAQARKTGTVPVEREEVTRAAQPERPAPSVIRGGKPAPLTLPATRAEKVTVKTDIPLKFGFGEGATIDMTPEKATSWAETIYTGLTPRFIMETANAFSNDETDKFYAAIARANSEVIDMYEAVSSGEQIDPTMYAQKLTSAIYSEAKSVAHITSVMDIIGTEQQKKFDAGIKEAVARYTQSVAENPNLDNTTKGIVLQALADVDTVTFYQRLRSDLIEFNTAWPETKKAMEQRGSVSAEAKLMALFQFFNSKGWAFANISAMQDMMAMMKMRLK